MMNSLNNYLMLQGMTEKLDFKEEIIFDIETYPNYFIVMFLVKGKYVFSFEMKNDVFTQYQELAFTCLNFTLVGFNSNNYDIAMLRHLLSQKATNKSLYQLSSDLVENQIRYYNLRNKYPFNDKIKIDTFDLIEPAPDPAKISLKKYAARIMCEELEDLPFAPHKSLSDFEITQLQTYCVKDLKHTFDLRQELSDEMALRFNLTNGFKMDVRSLSDAQIGEAVAIHYIEKRLGRKLPKPPDYRNKILRYKRPAYIQFQTPYMQNVFDTIVDAEYHVGDNGSPMIPKDVANLKVMINTTEYKIGIGGLHSKEKSQAYVCDENHRIYDIDGDSFYPTIIINNEYCPQGLEDIFIPMYKGDLVDPRLAYKRQAKLDSLTPEERHRVKQWANSMKIVINGLYGKLGSLYCRLYAPEMMISVCLTGQLILLMLIERLELAGIKVISANTDGIVTYSHINQYDLLKSIVDQWEKDVRMTTEWTPYQAIYSRDVNNYIAVKSDFDCQVKKGLKRKGYLADHWISDPNSFKMKNTPDILICRNAVANYILKDIPIENTINECKDIRQFLHLSEVNGGATFRNKNIGRVARFYISTNSTDCIKRVSNGGKVPNSDCAELMLNLSKNIPTDLNYKYYVDKAEDMLYDIGCKVKNRMAELVFS